MWQKENHSVDVFKLKLISGGKWQAGDLALTLIISTPPQLLLSLSLHPSLSPSPSLSYTLIRSLSPFPLHSPSRAINCFIKQSAWGGEYSRVSGSKWHRRLRQDPARKTCQHHLGQWQQASCGTDSFCDRVCQRIFRRQTTSLLLPEY